MVKLSNRNKQIGFYMAKVEFKFNVEIQIQTKSQNEIETILNMQTFTIWKPLIIKIGK